MSLLHPGEVEHLAAEVDRPVARVRALAMAALGPLVTGYAAVAALLATVTAIAPHGRFDTVGVLAAGVPGWLAAHQVPITLGHQELGALPLLPTIGLMLLVARTAAGAAERIDGHTPRHAGQIIAVMAGGHAVFGLVLALLTESHPVTAAAMPSLTYPALLAALASTAGVARRCGLVTALLARVDAPAAAGLRAGLLAVATLLAAGGAVLVLALLGSVTEVRETYTASASGFGAGAGMLLLSAGYLPNAVIGASAFVAGPGFSLGAGTVGPAAFAVGPLPAFPLLDAVPDRSAAWWPALCLIPLGIGVLIGWLLREVDEDPVTRLRAVAVAAVVTAMCCVVLSGAAGGRLGNGPLDPLSMRAAVLSVSMLGWVAIPGGLVAWFRGVRPEPVEPVGLIDFDEPEPEPEPDVDDVEDEPEPAEPAEPEPAEAEHADEPPARSE